jgi:hypothetical protein
MNRSAAFLTSLQVIKNFRYKVILAQRFAREFCACLRARHKALEMKWKKVEAQYGVHLQERKVRKFKQMEKDMAKRDGESRLTARRGTITLATASEFIQSPLQLAVPKSSVGQRRTSIAGSMQPLQQRRPSVALNAALQPAARRGRRQSLVAPGRRGSFAITLDNENQMTDAIILVRCPLQNH